jgi:hypothetical protein
MMLPTSPQRRTPGLQLRRAIIIQAEGNKVTCETCYRAVSCKALFDIVVTGSFALAKLYRLAKRSVEPLGCIPIVEGKRQR